MLVLQRATPLLGEEKGGRPRGLLSEDEQCGSFRGMGGWEGKRRRIGCKLSVAGQRGIKAGKRRCW